MRRLGGSELAVSPLAIGSWKTYERLPRETAVAVMRAARERGINFLDDARYNDDSGQAPLQTGYSEVVFGEVFRAAGWKRHEVVLANKLWWEFWPRENAAAELDGSLARMKMDYVDLIYAERPPDGFAMEELVRQVGGLLRTGKARAWGVLNWRPELVAQAGEAARRQGVPPPCAAQLAYSLVQRSMVEDSEMESALESCGAGVIASYVMAGGALTGKYARPDTTGRLSTQVGDPKLEPALRAAARLQALAARLGAAPAALAIAFALRQPRVTSVLFGATSPAQLEENAAALDLIASLDEAQLAELSAIGP